MTETRDAKRSPLDAAHRALGAKMAPFAGWQMPLEYAGTLSEHHAVREAVGVFDVSHLGKLLVTGADAARLLDEVLTNRFAGLATGRARYTLMLDDDGGIVDDLIVYALAADRLLAVPNAANADEVEARVRAVADGRTGVERLGFVTLAVQGPRSPQVLRAVVGSLPDLAYMQCVALDDLVVARSGYTGETGFEVFAVPERGPALWEGLLEAARAHGGAPCGLGARDTLRLEMGYPLHGNDIDRGTAPGEAGLDWAVAFDKERFVGKEALERRPLRTTLVGLRMLDRLIPRRGHRVLRAGAAVGTVTSGGFSPTLRGGIALAAIEPGAARLGEDVEVDVRGKTGRATIVRPPFVDRSPRGPKRAVR